MRRGPGLTADPAGRDAVTTALGVVLVAGVFTDGWAHVNRPGMESFFTPWHAMLYGGLGVVAGWLGLVVWRHWQDGAGGGRRAVVPPGYGWAVVGAGLFAAGGLSDLVWHELFGIEVALDALISPTHLLLGTGGLLILSTAMRAQGHLTAAGDGTWSRAALGSLALTLALVVFFLLYLSPFMDPEPVRTFVPTPEEAADHEAQEAPVVLALARYLLTSVLITVPLTLLLRAGTGLVRGGAALVVAAVALLPVVIVELPRVAFLGALGAVLGAVAFEVVASLRPGRIQTGRTGAAAAAGLVGAVWSGHFAALALADGVRWPVSMWLGTIVLAMLAAASVGHLAALGDRPRRVQLGSGAQAEESACMQR